ncbi:MAG TPA: hypothetical protein PLC54_01785 [Spirochaetales bacterium]|nr:hypothetical protein [Spirochaetales bacterium]
MKKLAVSTLVILALFALVLPVSAAPSKVLTKTLLDKFLKDLPGIMADLQNLDDDVIEDLDMGGEEEDETFNPATIKSEMKKAFEQPEIRKVLAKYGWGDNFADVYFAVLFGYTCVMYEGFYAMYPSPETKSYIDQLKALVHQDDIAMVKANEERISQAVDMDD